MTVCGTIVSIYTVDISENQNTNATLVSNRKKRPIKTTEEGT